MAAKHFLVALSFVSFISIVVSISAESFTHKATFKLPYVFLTSQQNGQEAEEIFSCSGRIYAYLTLAEEFEGEHLIEGFWFKPNGVLQEHTKFNAKLPSTGAKKVYMWFQFDSEAKTIFDEFVFGGDYGMGHHAFNGSWKLEIHCDGKFLMETSYTVVCS